MCYSVETIKLVTDIVCPVATIILTCALIYYTKKLWDESFKTRIQNIIPQISVIFYVEHGQIVYMKIMNTGKNDARDVKISCLTDCSYQPLVNKNGNLKNDLSKTYSYLPVKQSYDYLIGMYTSLPKQKINFELSFSDVSCEHLTKYPISIDLGDFEGTCTKEDYKGKEVQNLKDISMRLDEIKKILDKITCYNAIDSLHVHISESKESVENFNNEKSGN